MTNYTTKCLYNALKELDKANKQTLTEDQHDALQLLYNQIDIVRANVEYKLGIWKEENN